MKKRKKNLNGAQRTTNKSTVGNKQVNETAKSKKDFDKMNLFERMAYFEEIRNSSKINKIRTIKLINPKDDVEEEKKWRIDDENWDKLFEAFKQCVRYSRQKAKEELDEKKSHEESKVNTQSKSKGRKSKIDLEKLKEFLKANAERKVTKTEVRDFCGVSSFSIVRVELKKLPDAEEYFSYIIDLRKDNSPKAELIVPGEDSENNFVKESFEVIQNYEDTAANNEHKDSITESINPIVEPEKQNDDNLSKTVITSFFKLTDEELKNIVTNDAKGDKKSNNTSATSEIEVVSVIEPHVEQTVESKISITDQQQNVISVKSTKYPKPVAAISELFFLKNMKTCNFIFDASIYELDDIAVYKEIVTEMISTNINFVLWVSLKQFYTFDSIKKESCVAQELLKTIALDDGSHIKLVQDEIPESAEELAMYCKDNNLTLVSGFPINIIWCKVYGANILIPRYFKKLCPSPFKGNDVIGVDTSVLLVKQTQKIFEKAKTIWISNLQLYELNLSNSSYWATIAYYGNFDKAEVVVANHADSNHVHFFKKKGVSKVYSADYGFLAYAKFMNLPGELVFNSNEMKEASKSILLDYFKKQTGVDSRKINKLKSGDVISLDAIREKNENRLRIFTKINNVDIFVYDSHRRPKKSILRFIDVEKGDELLIQEGNIILIVKIINTIEVLGEVLYYGEEKNLPNNFIFIK